MQLVKTETLGYVAPTSEISEPPLIVPYSAALVTGTRAIVYVKEPDMPSFAEPALKTLTSVIQQNDLESIRQAFAKYGEMLAQPYDQPGTDFARELWAKYADKLVQNTQFGQSAASIDEASVALARIDATMKEAREFFAPADKPTFDGREIVLGPRAGDYYLVRHGLHEGELVVTEGAFKIDAEIQIQAKPSMMTPEGGGGGGHHHGGETSAPAKISSGEHAGHVTPPPEEFLQQMHSLLATFDQVEQSAGQDNIATASAAFTKFGDEVAATDSSMLKDHQRMLWNELAMLLGNDAVEGKDARSPEELQRVLALTQRHMQRLGEQLGVESHRASPGAVESHQEHSGH